MVLHFVVHKGKATGNILADDFFNVVTEVYQLNINHIVAVVTDTTGNMNTFGARLSAEGVIHLYCIDHNLQRCAILSFDDNNLPHSENAMKGARSLIESFTKSTQLTDKLNDIQTALNKSGKPTLKLLQDVKTRWWST